MLFTLVCLKGIWIQYISYEELQKTVLISDVYFRKEEKTFLVLEVQGIITDKGKKTPGSACSVAV